MVHELNMIQHVRDPTRYHNILDLCLSPDDDSISNVGVKSHFSTSDHSYITLDINLPVRIEPSRRTYRDFNAPSNENIISIKIIQTTVTLLSIRITANLSRVK